MWQWLDREVKVSLRWTVFYSLFLLLSFSCPVVNPPQPLTHPLEAHYAELSPRCEVKSVRVHTLEHFTCGTWSKLANWWASKTGMWCGAKHIFIRCPGTGSHSLCFLFPSSILNISSRSQTWAVFNVNFEEVPRRSWPLVNFFMVGPSHVLLFHGCFPLCPSLWLYIYLLSDWSSLMERPMDMSWAWTEASISVTSKPQATHTPWGDSSFRGAVLLAPVVPPSSSLWFLSLTSSLDLSLIKKIRL